MYAGCSHKNIVRRQYPDWSLFSFPFFFFLCRCGINKRKDENSEAERSLLENKVIIQPENVFLHFKNFFITIGFTVKKETN